MRLRFKNAQARKQNGGHCDVIYYIIIAWITVKKAAIISLIRIIINIRLGKKLCAFKKKVKILKEFLKSKMATKRRFRGANLKFDLQSESYRSVLAIIHFYDAQWSKIKIIQVSFVPHKWAMQPPQLMDYKGKSEFCLPAETSTLMVKGKQNSLFSEVPVIKCFVIPYLTSLY